MAVYSDADREAMHVKTADESYHIGPSLSRKSYLNIEALLNVAQKSGAEAIHPGYGFLSENDRFAKMCKEKNLVFIGPSAACLAKAGDKSQARSMMADKKVPIIPGSRGFYMRPCGSAYADPRSGITAARRAGPTGRVTAGIPGKN